MAMLGRARRAIRDIPTTYSSVAAVSIRRATTFAAAVTPYAAPRSRVDSTTQILRLAIYSFKTIIRDIIIAIMNFEKSPQENQETSEKLKPKAATRTVLFDQNGQVAIINVRRHKYYKIPGGGVEDGENIQDAAMREVKEESGCNCEIVGELGRIETEVPIWGMLDISDGFITVVKGDKSQPEYEDWEKERGFEIEWFSDIDTAISTIEGNTVAEPGMASLQERDLNFLKLARDTLNNRL